MLFKKDLDYKYLLNYLQKGFLGLAPGCHKTFCINLLFKAVKQLLFTLMKWYNLQKSVSKFTSKSFMRFNPSVISSNFLGINLLTLFIRENNKKLCYDENLLM